MNAIRYSQKLTHLFAAGIVCLAVAVAVNAQVKTETYTTHGPATKTVKVERGEVVYVSGHDLVVKKDDGTIVHFANVPDSTRATVDGKSLGIQDLRPGMKLERTTITTTTPKTVTTIQSVSGTVWHVTPPSSVILKLADGTNHQFMIPSGQKVTVNGQQVDAWGLKKGMKVTATKVVETPETVIAQQTKVTGTAPVTAAASTDDPIVFAWFVPAYPTMAAATPEANPAAAAELPKTASLLPLFGLFGVLAVWSSLALRTIRTNV
jgi:hypothetical protein